MYESYKFLLNGGKGTVALLLRIWMSLFTFTNCLALVDSVKKKYKYFIKFVLFLISMLLGPKVTVFLLFNYLTNENKKLTNL